MAVPSDIGSCLHWWDASDATTITGDPASELDDKVGSIPLTQASSDRRPSITTMGPNNLGALQFSGDSAGHTTADMLDNDENAFSSVPTAPLTIMIAWKLHTLDASCKIYDTVNGGGDRMLLQISSNTIYAWGGGQIAGPTANDLDIHVAAIMYVSGTGNGSFIFDGTTYTGTISEDKLATFRIGSRAGTPPTYDYAPMIFGEAAIFDEELTGSDLTDMLDHFSRWTTLSGPPPGVYKQILNSNSMLV